jgi:sulfate adenylyltransferase
LNFNMEVIEKHLATNNRIIQSPYGGILVDLMIPPEEIIESKRYANTLASIQISERIECDLELLATGAFSPLDQFMGKADYDCVLDEMRLTNGYIFPIPITLPVEKKICPKLGQDIALRNTKNELLAILTVEEIYEWELDEAARKVFDTLDLRHPLIAEMHSWGKFNISGRLKVLQLPRHFDFSDLRLTPTQTRARLKKLGRENVVAFQTRNPLHRAHEELTKKAIEDKDAVLLLHPVVGMTKPGDIDHYSRVRTYKILAERYYDRERLLLSLIPLAMRMAGPREALWHALIRRNYGATHLIVGRDHASPGKDSKGQPFYQPYAAQDLARQFSEELAVEVIPFRELIYLPEQDSYVEVDQAPADAVTRSISGTELREEYLNKGRRLPDWFMRYEAATILARSHPPRHQQGVCVWFTGLSGSGKSTTAEILTETLLAHGRRVTLLDGDVVRNYLSAGLGFTKIDRDINVRRIGFVAAEIAHHGGVAVCAAVSPYRAMRNEVRNMVGADCFIEVFVDTPLEVCEQRDAKGIYEKARRGEIKNLTGINDPYESPQNPEIVIETDFASPEQNARSILAFLKKRGFVLK